jgi:pimeloyl-ACP methyl ester carboxylesterase
MLSESIEHPAHVLGKAYPSTAERLWSKTKTLIHEGIQLVYDSYGTGSSAIVYIHGWTCSRTLWVHQSPLYTRYRSILVDLPGHGESDKPEVDYDHELFVRSIKAVLDAEGIRSAQHGRTGRYNVLLAVSRHFGRHHLS